MRTADTAACRLSPVARCNHPFSRRFWRFDRRHTDPAPFAVPIRAANRPLRAALSVQPAHLVDSWALLSAAQSVRVPLVPSISADAGEAEAEAGKEEAATVVTYARPIVSQNGSGAVLWDQKASAAWLHVPPVVVGTEPALTSRVMDELAYCSGKFRRLYGDDED